VRHTGCRLQLNVHSPLCMQGVDELKSIHTLPSLLLYEDGALVHIVEGELYCHAVHVFGLDMTHD
jgi:hypothetical protein